eukprot:2962693-Heterocapsa_arctica.AAC.1
MRKSQRKSRSRLSNATRTAVYYPPSIGSGPPFLLTPSQPASQPASPENHTIHSGAYTMLICSYPPLDILTRLMCSVPSAY